MGGRGGGWEGVSEGSWLAGYLLITSWVVYVCKE